MNTSKTVLKSTLQSLAAPDTEWGLEIRRFITPVLIAACWTYAAGFALGQTVHVLNKRLSSSYKAALGLPMALPAIRYEQWTCNDLRELLSYRKKALKRDLVAMAYGQAA